MSNLEKIVEELSTLTVIQAAELAKMLEEKWGVTAAAPVAVAVFFFFFYCKRPLTNIRRHAPRPKKTYCAYGSGKTLK